ncbi:MAG TPA: hypothetical protein VFB62_27010 [Polyangiaceae bacterium]|jgi:hypothetical protein|nr:hypothetical protein [Polyangiaceae bacterium]
MSLGAPFLTAALVPLQDAARYLRAQEVELGLGALTRERLMSGVDAGVAAAAGAAGVSVEKVARLLPKKELDARLASIEERQFDALDHWQALTGHGGSMLFGIAEVGDGAGELSACLDLLAQRFKLDEGLSQPLAALSAEMAAWTALLERCCTRIGKSKRLKLAQLRRRLVRGSVVVVGAALLITVATCMGQRALAHSRIRAALADGPCAAERIEDSDLERAGSEEQASVMEARRTCEAERERERRAAIARREAAERDKREEARRRAHAAACDALARDVEKGAISAGNKALAGKHVGLLERVSAGWLLATDVHDDFGELPCAGTPGGKRIRTAFARVLVTTAPRWILGITPSERAQKILAGHHASISADALQKFDDHIEEIAKRAMVSGKDELVARCLTLCKLKTAIGRPHKDHCAGALAVKR